MSWLFKDSVGIMKEIISWLFKDPINSGLAQFDHAQSSRIQSYEDVQYMGPKWPVSPNDFFSSENLLMSLLSFSHAYLHAKT